MIGIVDYGMSNLDSVGRAVAECGGDPLVIRSPDELGKVSALILPGVGAFEQGMANLRERRLIDGLAAEVAGNRIPILGICLGMQLLAERGFEGRSHGGTAGLGWIPGEVRRLPATERVPHVGWNEVLPDGASDGAAAMFRGLEDGRDFYFVHSYHLVPFEGAAAAKTPYCGGFCSAIAENHVWGVQFHPEKSQKAGFRLLANFIEAAC